MSTTVRRATWTVMLVAVGAKALGFAREVVVARGYGTSEVVDVFLAAVTIPAILGTILSFAVPNAFVPLFTTEPDSRRTRRLAAAAIAVAIAASSVVAAFAPEVVAVAAGGLDAAARASAATLVRIVAGTVAFAAIETLGRSGLHARKSFVRPGIAYAWQNVAIIAAVLAAPEGGARSLAWGYVVGSGLAAVWNVVPVGPPSSPRPPHAAVPATGVARWVALVVVADALGQAYAFLDRRYGSFLPEGTMAALQYANLLAFLPLGIVATGLGSAILPFLAESVGRDETDRAGEMFRRAVGACLEALVPLTLWFIVFREPLVTLALERGAFDETSRRMTAPLFAAYALGLLPGAVGVVAAKVFHAQRRAGPVLVAVVAGALVKWGAAEWFARSHGGLALAAGTGAGLSVAAAVLLSALPGWCRRGAVRGWARTVAATAVPVLAGIVAARGVASVSGAAALPEAVAGIALGAAALVVLAKPLGLREFATLAARVRGGGST